MQLRAQSFSGLIEWLGPVAPVVGTVECHSFLPLAETRRAAPEALDWIPAGLVATDLSLDLSELFL